MTQVLGCEGINLVYSLGAAAGQRSPHMIIYLIPRYKDDQVSIIWNPTQMKEEDVKVVFKGLTEALKGAAVPVINMDKKKKEVEVIEEKKIEVIEEKPRIPSY